MSLPEKLRYILVKLGEVFDAELPDPDELEHSGEVMIRGQAFTTRSSAPLEELANQEKFTVYLHNTGGPAAGDGHLYYFHFEGRREISAVNVSLSHVDGSVQQSVTMSSLPREIFLQRVERRLGKSSGNEQQQRRRRPFQNRRPHERQPPEVSDSF